MYILNWTPAVTDAELYFADVNQPEEREGEKLERTVKKNNNKEKNTRGLTISISYVNNNVKNASPCLHIV